MCDIYVGADAFLLVTGFTWLHGHNQMELAGQRLTRKPRRSGAARLTCRTQPDRGHPNRFILKMILVPYKSDVGLPGGAGDVGGDDVGSVPVQAAAGPVVPHCGSRVCMGGGLLHVAQRHASVETGGDERVPERVRADVLAHAGAARDLADDPSGAVPVQPPSVMSEEDGSVAALPGGQVDRPGGAGRERDGDDLTPLRVIVRVRCPRSRPRCSM